MKPNCSLAGRGATILHIAHGSLLTLTILFLILGGVSGPSTGYWWLQVTYTDPHGGLADGVTQGTVREGYTWRFGALGACIDGQPCPKSPHPPEAYTAAHGALVYHLAGAWGSTEITSAAVLFAFVALVNLLLLLYFATPDKRSVKSRIWTICLPIGAYLPVLMAFVAALAVRQNIRSGTVARVETLPAFWLSTLALTTSTIYVLLAEWMGYLYDRRAKSEARKERKRRTMVQVAGHEQGIWAWLSPFGRTAKRKESSW